MKKSLILMIFFWMFLNSCSGNSEPWIHGRENDWKRENLHGKVKQKTEEYFFIHKLSETNNIHPYYIVVHHYNMSGDKTGIFVYSTPFYEYVLGELGTNNYQDRYQQIPFAKISYSVTNRNGTFFLESSYTNFLHPSWTMNEESVYDKQGRLIGQGTYSEGRKGIQSHFTIYTYDTNNYLVREKTEIQNREKSSSYIIVYHNDLLGHPTNGFRIIGKMTNELRYQYNSFGQKMREMERDQRGQGIILTFDTDGRVVKREIYDVRGKRLENDYYNKKDPHGNVIQEWEIIKDRKKGFKPRLESMSFTRTTYEYWR